MEAQNRNKGIKNEQLSNEQMGLTARSSLL